MTYVAADDRYDQMRFNRCGGSGLVLPAISLGLWQNFGGINPLETGRAIVRRAFDLGVTHFDLANNYGPPYGSAEESFGRLLRDDLRPYRDELIISTKAGYDMWPGPYGDGGSRKYLLASLDQSLQRMGLDYVDIFYSHRFDTATPLEETMGALDSAVRQGKALYVGISSYSAEKTREAAAILRDLGTPLLIHQPSYSLLNRWIEPDLLDALGDLGVGCITFSPLAQGVLTDRYLNGIPEGSRASRDDSLSPDALTEETLARVQALNEIAAGRRQSLAQMALAWTLRDARVTSTLVGASSVAQLEQNLAALEHLEFSQAELDEIDGIVLLERAGPSLSPGVVGRRRCGRSDGERSAVRNNRLEDVQHVARREAAPFVFVAVLVDVLLAANSAWRDWRLYAANDWWVWLVLALPALVLALVFLLGLGRMGVSSRHRRKAAVSLLGILAVANLVAVGLVLGSLVAGGGDMTGPQLLASAAVVLVVNVITFSLVFWEIDCGGPVARALADHRVVPDFQFPQDENPSLARAGWTPVLKDYLYVAVTNSIAFSPTDAMPLTHRAKLSMAIESLVAAVTVLIVAARAVNILHG